MPCQIRYFLSDLNSAKKQDKDLTWAAILKSLAGIPTALTDSKEDLLLIIDISPSLNDLKEGFQ